MPILTPSFTFVTIVAIFLSPAAAVGDIATTSAAAGDALGTYLVVVCRANGPKEDGEKLREWHASLLASVLNTSAGTVLEEARSSRRHGRRRAGSSSTRISMSSAASWRG